MAHGFYIILVNAVVSIAHWDLSSSSRAPSNPAFPHFVENCHLIMMRLLTGPDIKIYCFCLGMLDSQYPIYLYFLLAYLVLKVLCFWILLFHIFTSLLNNKILIIFLKILCHPTAGKNKYLMTKK